MNINPPGSVLIKWYAENKRDLPWRSTKDPYFIWISEIILQQTRVDQGIHYFYRFIETFPDIFSLAAASEEDILKLWQGLGYYSRARNLHFTAQNIVKNYKGKFPAQHTELLKLKGIGEYTAAAIASFAFDLPCAVLDGNVFRFLSRYFGIETAIDSGHGKKQFLNIANEILDKKFPAEYNQAIMEFGALQCKPSAPDCPQCPLMGSCFAYATQKVGSLPFKSKKLKPVDRFFYYLNIHDADFLLLNKRGSADIWQGLYDFPLIETLTECVPEDLIGRPEWVNILKSGTNEILSISKKYIHKLSHQTIHAIFFEVKVNDVRVLNHERGRPVAISALQSYPFSRLMDIYLKASVL
jgi:A/G-specific adenine glycosylase